MPHTYTEDQLVEQTVIGLFAELGWTTVFAFEATSGAKDNNPSASKAKKTHELLLFSHVLIKS